MPMEYPGFNILDCNLNIVKARIDTLPEAIHLALNDFSSLTPLYIEENQTGELVRLCYGGEAWEPPTEDQASTISITIKENEV